MPWDLYHEKKGRNSPLTYVFASLHYRVFDISDISLLFPSTAKERDFQITVLSNNSFVPSAETKRVTYSIVIKM